MKRIISFFLCAVTVASLCLAAIPVSAQIFVDDETYILGDANGDGEQNGKDALAIKATVAGLDGYTVITDASDFNADGTVDAKDSYLMKSCLSGSMSFDTLEGDHQLYKLTIGGHDITEYSIVIPADTDSENDNHHYAAMELSKYIGETTGFEIPVYRTDENTERHIYFHPVEIDSAEAKELELGLEGYIYKVEDGELHIYGTLRGNMYAVYEIIEDYLGVRFYSGERTYIYKNRTVDIPEGTDRYYHPRLNFRHVLHTFSHNTAEEFYFPRKLNGTNLYAYYDTYHGTLTGTLFLQSHSFVEQWQMATGTMPDESAGSLADRLYQKWQSGELKDWQTWQPCATDPKVYDKLFSGLLDFCRMMEARGHIMSQKYEYETYNMSFATNDNANFCTCRNCRKIALTQKEGYSGLYLEMGNKAVRDIQEYYPGLKISITLYDYTIPATIRPHKDIIVSYVAHACNNHILGTGECGENKTFLGRNNLEDEIAMKEWAALCRESGAEIWHFTWPVNYHYWLSPSPSVFDLYYNYNYLVNECGFTGILYEGAGATYNFESLKAYLASRLMWDTDMTYDEFIGHMKEYLYMHYGDGYEYVYEYLVMQNEAGDLAGCYSNNHARPFDMYSHDYLRENYDEMRGLILKAIEMCERDDSEYYLRTLLACCDFMGLSSSYKAMYVNGDSESRAVYEERYTEMYNFLKDNGLPISSHTVYTIPDNIDFTVDPMTQFYINGSWEPSKNCP